MTTYILRKVYPPEDVTDVPYTTEGEAVRPHLPEVKILLDSGKAMTTTATWSEPRRAFDSLDEWSTHVWMADGVVDLPYGVENPDDVSLDAVGKVFVNAADNVARWADVSGDEASAPARPSAWPKGASFHARL